MITCTGSDMMYIILIFINVYCIFVHYYMLLLLNVAMLKIYEVTASN